MIYLLSLILACSDYVVSPIDTNVIVDTQDTSIEYQAPTALCSVDPNPALPIFDSITWVGSNSFDLDGIITSYEWVLESKPEGSVSEIPLGTDPDRSGFIADLAGTYVGVLLVEDNTGQESSCTAILEAVPNQNLWVELYWTHSGDDLDLHLLAPSGAVNTDADCYFANCTTWSDELDWGIYGYTQDNPHLDLDDIPNRGPENINIQDPKPGIYTVLVHDYPGSVNMQSNTATINIYLNGSRVWTSSKPIGGENTYTYFAKINTQTGQITSL
jgi:hypothetical protein